MKEVLRTPAEVKGWTQKVHHCDHRWNGSEQNKPSDCPEHKVNTKSLAGSDTSHWGSCTYGSSKGEVSIWVLWSPAMAPWLQLDNKIGLMPQCNETEINTSSESKFIADQNGTFIFFQSNFPAQSYELWMLTIRKLISRSDAVLITRRKFWTRRTSGSVRCRTISWKYAYRNLTLHSGSLTRSVVMRFRSSARDWRSRIDYWTLNSRNVNSMFAAYARFMLSRSHNTFCWASYNSYPREFPKYSTSN